MNKMKEKLIEEIMQVCAVNNVHNDGDVFLSLCFLTETELIKIAKELYIKIPE